MRTISEHIDDLDRMVDGGAAKSEIRSQIAFIGREVAAFEAEYAQLGQAHTKLQEAHSQADKIHAAGVADLQEKQHKAMAAAEKGQRKQIADQRKRIADLKAEVARCDSEDFSGSGGVVERPGG